MLFSEAMRLGSAATPQAYGEFFNENGETCGMGAAMYALGARPIFVEAASCRSYLSLDALGQVIRFYLFTEKVLLSAELARRNNVMRQTREQIADWLVQSENDFEVPPHLYADVIPLAEEANNVLVGSY